VVGRGRDDVVCSFHSCSSGKGSLLWNHCWPRLQTSQSIPGVPCKLDSTALLSFMRSLCRHGKARYGRAVSHLSITPPDYLTSLEPFQYDCPDSIELT
jgi:hypothetical protein